jgi:hypothetical protein
MHVQLIFDGWDCRFGNQNMNKIRKGDMPDLPE